jgi:hypothetical protein
MMTYEEHAAFVAGIVARRDEEADYQAAALATALAHRIDQRIKEVDGLLTYMARARKRAA